jgi:hypothetical protein
LDISVLVSFFDDYVKRPGGFDRVKIIVYFPRFFCHFSVSFDGFLRT